ncbi:MAG TPA: RNA-binding S4 domain-containing protein [Casimicrobiaceae bacterium]|nr:RNA-binding S4 domain-containing protein [Casimicrobiaceae bacterium]
MRPAASDPAAPARVRLDKWLWAARFYRTRSLAALAITAGHVRVDDQRIKPSRLAAAGERVVLRRDGLVWDIVVLALSDRRGDAAAAAQLYRESPQSIATRTEEIARRKAAAATAPTSPGRPTKRERRKLRAFFEER